MQNPLSGVWTAFLTDAKYSNLRHAVVAGAAVFAVGILQALTQTDFGSYTFVVAAIAGFGIKWLSSFTV